MAVAKRDLQLASGEIISVGMNFFTLQLISKYPGGMNKMKRDMLELQETDPESDEYGELLPVALDAVSYMLYCMVRSAGISCTQETCAMMVGLEDIDALYSVFEEFEKAADKMSVGKTFPRVGK